MLPAEYDLLLSRHTALHTPMYERVDLDLVCLAGGAGAAGGGAARGAATGSDPNPALLEAMFHAGRYMLISSTGVLPPRLTGLWLGEWGAAWSGDFTTDANLNLQLAGASIGALPEAVESLRALIADQIDDWRDNARAVFGARGVLAPSRTDGEHGRLFHLNAEWPWAMWVAGADWLLFPLYEHWQVTGDDGSWPIRWRRGWSRRRCSSRTSWRATTSTAPSCSSPRTRRRWVRRAAPGWPP